MLLTSGSDYAEIFPPSRPCSPGQVVSLHEDKKVYPAVEGDPFDLPLEIIFKIRCRQGRFFTAPDAGRLRASLFRGFPG